MRGKSKFLCGVFYEPNIRGRMKKGGSAYFLYLDIGLYWLFTYTT